jgi:hypothetical protein
MTPAVLHPQTFSRKWNHFTPSNNHCNNRNNLRSVYLSNILQYFLSQSFVLLNVEGRQETVFAFHVHHLPIRGSSRQCPVVHYSVHVHTFPAFVRPILKLERAHDPLRHRRNCLSVAQEISIFWQPGKIPWCSKQLKMGSTVRTDINPNSEG